MWLNMYEVVKRVFRSRRIHILILLSLLLITIPTSLSVGVYQITIIDVLSMISGNSCGDLNEVVMLRLRRALTSIFIGALLACGGVAMQAVLRNPMASPFTLGIANAAALGVAIALITGVGGTVSRWVLTYYNPYIIPLFAFLFAFIQVLMVLMLAYRAGLSERALILAAIAMSFYYQAILYLIQYLILNELQVSIVVFWTFGDVGRVGWVELWLILAVSVALALYYVFRSSDLDLISLSDDVTAASGVDPKKLRFEVSLITALGVSVATSFAGVIAFLCLISPHIARLLVGSASRYLLPASMLVGSTLLLAADCIGRAVISPVILPVGITISIIGSPLLLYLLLRR